MRPEARRLAIAGATMILAAAALGAWILVRGETPFVVDAGWNELLLAWRTPAVTAVASFLNIAGGVVVSTLVVPAIAVVALGLRRRWRAAAFFVISIAASGLLVQLLKHLFGRARPEEILVTSDYGSFPSGHTANAATVATLLVLLVPRLWALVVGGAWVVLMALSRTYLHAHWLTDTLGGALVGIGTVFVVAALFGPLGRRAPRAT